VASGRALGLNTFGHSQPGHAPVLGTDPQQCSPEESLPTDYLTITGLTHVFAPHGVHLQFLEKATVQTEITQWLLSHNCEKKKQEDKKRKVRMQRVLLVRVKTGKKELEKPAFWVLGNTCLWVTKVPNQRPGQHMDVLWALWLSEVLVLLKVESVQSQCKLCPKQTWWQVLPHCRPRLRSRLQSPFNYQTCLLSWATAQSRWKEGLLFLFTMLLDQGHKDILAIFGKNNQGSQDSIKVLPFLVNKGSHVDATRISTLATCSFHHPHHCLNIFLEV
jgi:hypothetical protein